MAAGDEIGKIGDTRPDKGILKITADVFGRGAVKGEISPFGGYNDLVSFEGFCREIL